MFFYEVAPGYRQYHGNDALTYHADSELQIGQVIVVKIRSASTLAFVVRNVSKPEFKTSPIDLTTEFVIPKSHLELFEWIRSYYPGPLGITAGLFLPPSLPKKGPEPSAAALKSDPLPELSEEQKSTLQKLNDAQVNSAILHGDTGTGKTRVYIELALKTLESGRSVIVLTPEISLTPQLVNALRASLNAPIIVTHSNLTTSQRGKLWQAVAGYAGPQVIVGPRSALFMPVRSLGLIVVDEFHEHAYKQEQSPNYQALRVASSLSAITEAKLIMGSATPSINDYFVAKAKNIPILRMTQKPLTDFSEAPIEAKVVDLGDKDQLTKYPLITKDLMEEIRASLAREEQVLLFLNKRGSARLILCSSCGWRALCPKCDLPYTYHSDGHHLRCHTCGNKEPAPNVCPECKSTDIVFKSPGTKAIAEAVQKAFPDARVARFDKDNLKAERLEQRHQEVVAGEVDILIGTQILAKGHDLPKLSLVGILLGESGLQFPDYTSEERSYQLIRQLAGRVGRGHRAGKVIIQAYDPDNEAIKAAAGKESWNEFYDNQLRERKKFGFPPFYHVMKIEITRAKPKTSEDTADAIAEHILQNVRGIEIVGPSPSFIEKRAGSWTWQIIVKAKDRSRLIEVTQNLPAKCTFDLDPAHLL